MKLNVRSKFFTRVQVAQSDDLAATRWVGCLSEVVYSQTPLGDFRPSELRVKEAARHERFAVAPVVQKNPKITETQKDADLTLRACSLRRTMTSLATHRGSAWKPRHNMG